MPAPTAINRIMGMIGFAIIPIVSLGFWISPAEVFRHWLSHWRSGKSWGAFDASR